jgi:hypothetical protein
MWCTVMYILYTHSIYVLCSIHSMLVLGSSSTTLTVYSTTEHGSGLLRNGMQQVKVSGVSKHESGAGRLRRGGVASLVSAVVLVMRRSVPAKII